MKVKKTILIILIEVIKVKDFKMQITKIKMKFKIIKAVSKQTYLDNIDKVLNQKHFKVNN